MIYQDDIGLHVGHNNYNKVILQAYKIGNNVAYPWQFVKVERMSSHYIGISLCNETNGGQVNKILRN